MPPSGLALVLDALSYFQRVRREQFRFQTLLLYLREDPPVDFQVRLRRRPCCCRKG